MRAESVRGERAQERIAPPLLPCVRARTPRIAPSQALLQRGFACCEARHLASPPRARRPPPPAAHPSMTEGDPIASRSAFFSYAYMLATRPLPSDTYHEFEHAPSFFLVMLRSASSTCTGKHKNYTGFTRIIVAVQLLMDSSGTFRITGRNLQSLLSMGVSFACSIPGVRAAPHAVALQAPGRGGL